MLVQVYLILKVVLNLKKCVASKNITKEEKPRE